MSFGTVFLDACKPCLPGDMPPENGGYLEMMDWAETQLGSGLLQVECATCGKGKFPQELTGESIVRRLVATDRRGRNPRQVELTGWTCWECAS